MKISNKFIFIISALFCVCLAGIIIGIAQEFTGENIPTKYNVNIEGKVNDEKTAEECMAVLIKNYDGVTKGKIDEYLETIAPEFRENSKKEIEPFFTDYKLENTLIRFRVMKQTDNFLAVEASQKSVAVWTKQGAEEYKPHISTITYEFAKQGQNWFIKKSEITDNNFI